MFSFWDLLGGICKKDDVMLRMANEIQVQESDMAFWGFCRVRGFWMFWLKFHMTGSKVAMISGSLEADFETSPTSSCRVPFVFNYFLGDASRKIDQVLSYMQRNYTCIIRWFHGLVASFIGSMVGIRRDGLKSAIRPIRFWKNPSAAKNSRREVAWAFMLPNVTEQWETL